MNERQWDIVHFAGHAYAAGRDQGGYLFVGRRGGPEEVKIETIAPVLRESRLLYLSGCESASAAFAAEAARSGIPAVIGFRWPVHDESAALFATLFYRHLFKKRTLDLAFWMARSTFHRWRPRNNAWASALLAMGLAP